jgi:hypothetical protein
VVSKVWPKKSKILNFFSNLHPKKIIQKALTEQEFTPKKMLMRTHWLMILRDFSFNLIDFQIAALKSFSLTDRIESSMPSPTQILRETMSSI